MESGDYIGAERDAERAKNWCIVAFVTGIISILISLAFSL